MAARSLPLPLALLAAALAAGPLSGQRLPGVPGGDGLSARGQKAVYLADVVQGVKKTMAAWGDAWSADALPDLLGTYTDDALVIFGDEGAARGRDQVAERLASWLEGTGSGEMFVQEVDGSGAMAMVYGAVHFGGFGGDGGASRTGEAVTVFVRQGDEWRIRSQVFVFR